MDVLSDVISYHQVRIHSFASQCFGLLQPRFPVLTQVLNEAVVAGQKGPLERAYLHDLFRNLQVKKKEKQRQKEF